MSALEPPRHCMLVARASEVKESGRAAAAGRVYAAALPDGRSRETRGRCGGHMRRLGHRFVVASFFAILSAPLLAQVPTGTIAGTVTDQVNAVLPKATVTVTNKDTGATR